MALTRPETRCPTTSPPGSTPAGCAPPIDARPPYQRNDYLGWIARAKRPETRETRVVQMLDELAGGTRYMKMGWRSETCHLAKYRHKCLRRLTAPAGSAKLWGNGRRT